MKKIYSIILVLFVHLLCYSQTPMPYEDYLVQQYSNSLSTKMSYGTIQAVADNSKQNVFAFACQTSDVTYNGKTYAADGNAGLLLQFKASTGEIVWNANLGNTAAPITNIEALVKDPSGNICIAARGDFQTATALVLGSQTFQFRTDMKPKIVVATFNPSTRVWSKVRFVYAPDQQGLMVTPKFDASGNLYICGTVSSSNLYIDNNQVVTVGSTLGSLIFAYKENSQGTVVYKKQTTLIRPSYVENIFFDVDNAESLYITGYISYVDGAMSLDGVVVKNDTISNAYDYSYSDIFLYKLNASGAVQFGKTYLYNGNENPRAIHALPNGTVYMLGEYNGSLGSFPTSSGNQFYNRFIANISGTNGAFNWIYPINSNMYYSDRFPFNSLIDKDGNYYFTSNFCPNTISFMGTTFTKRNTKYGTSNTLCAKISPSGNLLWGRVLGPVTTFETNYVDNPKANSLEVGTSLFLQTSSLSYGTNTEFAWGADAVPAITITPSMWGSMAVVNKTTGDIKYGYYQGYTNSLEIDSLDYFVMRNNYLSWDIARFKANVVSANAEISTNGEGLSLYPNPAKDVLMIKSAVPVTNVEIYSMDGKKLMQSAVVDGKLAVGKLASGIYVLKAGNRFAHFVKI